MKSLRNLALIITLNIILILYVNNQTVNSSAQIFLAILCHETAHVLTAHLLGVKVNNVNLHPIGIRMNLYSCEGSILKSAAVCLSGSIFGLITASGISLLRCERFDVYIYASISLSTVNLLPIRRLDGGEVLSLLINKIFLPDTAEKILKTISASIILLFWLITVTFQMKYEVNLVMLGFAIYLIYSDL